VDGDAVQAVFVVNIFVQAGYAVVSARRKCRASFSPAG